MSLEIAMHTGSYTVIARFFLAVCALERGGGNQSVRLHNGE